MSARGWALITGAGRRIGRALALSAAEAGFDIVVHFRSSERDAEVTAADVRVLGRQATTTRADLADPAACERLILSAPAPLTLLVNSASIFEDDRIESLALEGFDGVMAVNLRAPLLLAKAFQSALPSDRDGLIVNITDQRVWRLNPQFLSYTLSKAALWTATQTLAQALAARIRVNAIGPGPTLANIHQTPESFAREAAAVPLERAASPEEIGAALRYLIEARSVTGQMIAVDGGQHLSWRTPDLMED